MALGNLPQPAKALVKAVVNLECLWGEEEWKPALAPLVACSKMEGAQFVFLTFPFKGFT